MWMRMIPVALALSGCATPGTWLNEGRTPEQARLDGYECQRDGEAYAAALGFNGNPLIVADRARECLVAHGYVWTAAR